MEVKEGYKKTEVGVIPMAWKVKALEELVRLKNGYAFSSELFSTSGPIIITPGNFKLSGGLKFHEKNTLRYSGHVSSEMQFKNGDLIIVMTDLTPDCNLLGKPGIINSENVILHNQRIGKINIVAKQLTQNYLYWFFVSDIFSKRMKDTATGSTVRHTSNGSIYKTLIAIPTILEQTAIATALSDTDSLINSLEKLISKKGNIKQGAMQKLLQPKEGWEVKKLGEIADIIGGGTPSTNIPSYWNGEINWFTPTEIGKHKYTFSSLRRITKEGLNNCSARILPIGTILLTTRAGIGDLSILMTEGCTNQGFQSLIARNETDNEFLYYLVSTLKNILIQNASGSTFLEISPGKLKQIEVSIPLIEEQIRIATILSDLDAEISALQSKLEKYKKIKAGMMQQLLTGKIRLV